MGKYGNLHVPLAGFSQSSHITEPAPRKPPESPPVTVCPKVALAPRVSLELQMSGLYDACFSLVASFSQPGV